MGRFKINFIRIFGFVCLLFVSLIFLNSKFFLIEQVQVFDNLQVSTEDILVNSGIMFKQTIFQLDREAIVAALRENPVIYDVDVGLFFPNTLRLYIHERQPWCLVDDGKGEYACVSQDGVVIYYPVAEQQFGLPIFRGLGLLKLNLGEEVQHPMFKEGLLVLSSIDPELLPLMKELNLGDCRLYLDLTGNNLFSVELGNFQQLQQKLANLKVIVDKVDLNKIAGIDLRVPDIPTVTSRSL